MSDSKQPMARLALACLDLTSLNDGDGEADIERLCAKAQGPFGPVAAVCVWPRFASHARSLLPPNIGVAAVANFPQGGTAIEPVLREVAQIAQAGAQEVDLVLPWRALQAGDVAACVAMLQAVRRASQGLTLKLIIESGELASAALIRQACQIGLAEGVDFLKTSTGKSPKGATPEAAQTMLQAISEDAQSPQRVGFKVSGGVRTVADAALYAGLQRQWLGQAALTPRRWRIGASSLLADIEATLGGTPAAPTTRGSY